MAQNRHLERRCVSTKRRNALVLLCLSVGFAIFLGFVRDPFGPFDIRKVRNASQLNASVTVQTILPNDAEMICVLGSYQQPKFLDKNKHFSLIQQLDKSMVKEGFVRIAIFDDQDKIIDEGEPPMRRSEFNVDIDMMEDVFCAPSNALKVNVEMRQKAITIKFLN